MKNFFVGAMLFVASLSVGAQTYNYSPYVFGPATIAQPMHENTGSATGADGQFVTLALTMNKVNHDVVGSTASVFQVQVTREADINGSWVYNLNQLVYTTGTITTEAPTKDASGHTVYNFLAVGSGGYYDSLGGYHTITFTKNLSWVYLGVGRSAGYKWSVNSGTVVIQ